MAGFWPTAASDPSSTAPMVEFAHIWREVPKIVYSRTLEGADWNTTIVRDVVAEEVLALKAQPGGDLALGGADLAAAFMHNGLIDEYRLYRHPVVIGRGKPLFPRSGPRIDLSPTRGRSATGRPPPLPRPWRTGGDEPPRHLSLPTPRAPIVVCLAARADGPLRGRFRCVPPLPCAEHDDRV